MEDAKILEQGTVLVSFGGSYSFLQCKGWSVGLYSSTPKAILEYKILKKKYARTLSLGRGGFPPPLEYKCVTKASKTLLDMINMMSVT